MDVRFVKRLHKRLSFDLLVDQMDKIQLAKERKGERLILCFPHLGRSFSVAGSHGLDLHSFIQKVHIICAMSVPYFVLHKLTIDQTKRTTTRTLEPCCSITRISTVTALMVINGTIPKMTTMHNLKRGSVGFPRSLSTANTPLKKRKSNTRPQQMHISERPSAPYRRRQRYPHYGTVNSGLNTQDRHPTANQSVSLSWAII